VPEGEWDINTMNVKLEETYEKEAELTAQLKGLLIKITALREEFAWEIQTQAINFIRFLNREADFERKRISTFNGDSGIWTGGGGGGNGDTIAESRCQLVDGGNAQNSEDYSCNYSIDPFAYEPSNSLWSSTVFGGYAGTLSSTTNTTTFGTGHYTTAQNTFGSVGFGAWGSDSSG